MYKGNSRFLQHSTRMTAGRPRKANRSGKPIIGPGVEGSSKKRKKAALKSSAVKISAERMLKKWAKERLLGAKAPRRVLPSFTQDQTPSGGVSPR